MTIGYLGAFLGGVLALLSPCSALLLPAFFAYAFADRVRLLLRTAVFYLGLLTTLVPMGMAAGTFGAAFSQHRDVVVLIGGLVMIALGLAQLAGLGFGSVQAQQFAGRIKPSSALSVYLLGTVYGLAGFCAGPLLGSVLTMATTAASPAYGGVLLAMYALGMALPLFAVAALWDRFDLGRRAWLRGRSLRLGPLHLHSTRLVSALLFVALGVLFLVTDGTGSLGSPISIDTQFRAQVWVQRVAGRVPDLTLLATALGGLAIPLTWVVLGRRRRAARNTAVETRADPAGRVVHDPTSTN